MAIQEPDNPYAPGPGTNPPHLAGRKNEKSEIKQALVRIRKKPLKQGMQNRVNPFAGQLDKQGRLAQVSPPLVFIGPRGVGKTVLISWAERKAEEMDVRCAFLSEQKLSGPVEGLGKSIMGRKGFDNAVKKGTLKLSIGQPGVLGAEAEVSKSTAVLSLEDIISQQLEQGPLMLVLDEAHAVKPELLRAFCIAIQEFVLRGQPLAVVLAGTPDLDEMLLDSDAMFMERSRIMPMSLLEKDETFEALSVPAINSGLPMDDDAIEALVEWTDCYPLFIQMAGEEAWKVARIRNGNKITLADAKKALSVTGQHRRLFYYRRYRALIKDNLEKFALQAIKLIEADFDKSIEYKKLIAGLQEANKKMQRDEIVTVIQSLKSHGFIYETKECFETCIPSLFDYVKEKSATRQTTNA